VAGKGQSPIAMVLWVQGSLRCEPASVFDAEHLKSFNANLLSHPSAPFSMRAGNLVLEECDGSQNGIGHALSTGGSCLLKMFYTWLRNS